MLGILAQCANVQVPEASELAMQYYRSGNVLWIVQQAWSLLVPILFLWTGFSGMLNRFSERVGKNWFFTIVVYLVLFIAIYQAVNLPLSFYGDYIRQHSYGLSTETLSKWFADYGKESAVTLIMAIAFVWIFYLILKKSPRRWWIYGALVNIAIVIFLVFVQPIWFDPLFNKFGPMKDKQLEGQILGLAARAGIENGRVYEVDKSAETKMLNAYVVGFGKTNRIVLWDTTIQQMKPTEILFVMGHEMGHYVLRHVQWLILFLSAMLFLIYYLIYKTANFLLARYHHVFRFEHLYQIASLPLFLLLFTFYMLLASPLFKTFSRMLEHEADRFGLEITQNNQAAAEAFIVLQKKNLSNPRPGSLFILWRASHPPLAERIEFANSYCPWQEGKPLRYGKHFKE